MPQHKHSVLTGTQLLDVLSLTAEYVKVLGTHGNLLGRVEPRKALLMARAGSYVGKGTLRRVHHIRESDLRTDAKHTVAYWDSFKMDYPVLQPYAPGRTMVTTRSRLVRKES